MRWTSASLVAVLALSLLAGAPATLRLNDLVNHPERLPAKTKLNKAFRLNGGKPLAVGDEVAVLEFNGAKVTVDAGNERIFEINPGDCTLLESANEIWSKLSAAQREIDLAKVVNDASLWPMQVKTLVGFNIEGGKPIEPGTDMDVFTLTREGIKVALPGEKNFILIDVAKTDAIARARELALIDPMKRPSRIANALRGKLMDAQGKPADEAKLDTAKVFALYFGASWCGPCRQFSPSLVKYVNKTNSPVMMTVMMSNDEEDGKMLGYMKEEKMPFPALPLAVLQKNGLLISYTGKMIPQLLIVDRFGKLLADTYQNGQYVGPAVALRQLDGILRAAAK